MNIAEQLELRYRLEVLSLFKTNDSLSSIDLLSKFCGSDSQKHSLYLRTLLDIAKDGYLDEIRDKNKNPTEWKTNIKTFDYLDLLASAQVAPNQKHNTQAQNPLWDKILNILINNIWAFIFTIAAAGIIFFLGWN